MTDLKVWAIDAALTRQTIIYTRCQCQECNEAHRVYFATKAAPPVDGQFYGTISVSLPGDGLPYTNGTWLEISVEDVLRLFEGGAYEI